MIFYNDEGTENGGLIFGWLKNDKGKIVNSGGSLSFDRYGAGQTIQLAGVDNVENHFAGLGVNDVAGQRVWVGRGANGLASISLAGQTEKSAYGCKSQQTERLALFSLTLRETSSKSLLRPIDYEAGPWP